MAWHNTWEKVFEEKEWARYPAESLIRFIAKNFYKKDRKNTRILEIGCGPGANVWYMSREGFDVYGIDGSKTAVTKAKERIKKDGLNADLRVGDAADLGYENDYFNAVIDVECLYSNSREDAENILIEIKRVLKKDGLFYSRTFAEGTYIGCSQETLGDLTYRNISDGPLAVGSEGVVRLTDKKGISALYGKFFKVISIDKLEYTNDNAAMKVSEWIIICQNKG